MTRINFCVLLFSLHIHFSWLLLTEGDKGLVRTFVVELRVWRILWRIFWCHSLKTNLNREGSVAAKGKYFGIREASNSSLWIDFFLLAIFRALFRRQGVSFVVVIQSVPCASATWHTSFPFAAMIRIQRCAWVIDDSPSKAIAWPLLRI